MKLEVGKWYYVQFSSNVFSYTYYIRRCKCVGVTENGSEMLYRWWWLWVDSIRVSNVLAEVPPRAPWFSRHEQVDTFDPNAAYKVTYHDKEA